MLQVILNFIYIMLVGGLGILFMVFVKINDLTDLNPNLGFWSLWKLFMRKAVASILISATGLLLYAILRNQVMAVFITGDATKILNRLFAAQMLMGAFIGAGLQWGIYKFAFKKMDGIMKIWCGDPKNGFADPNTQLITPKTDGTVVQPEPKASE